MDYDTRAKVDLHIHSTASDGSLTPAAILALAVRQGLAAIALTDHDSVSGVQQVINSPIPAPLEFLSGIEISAAAPDRFSYQGSIHILGYGIDVTDPGLLKVVKQLAAARAERIPRIVDRLKRAGLPIGLEEVNRRIGSGSAGRPHVAKVLVEKGIVDDVDKAFEIWLAKGRPGYVDKYRLPADQAIKTIRQAGGVAVLAHPWLIFKTIDQRLEKMVALLAEMGLTGLEVLYPKHPPPAVEGLLEMARRFDLAVSGGTDFHGSVTPEIQLGSAGGDFQVPYEIFLNLQQRIAEHRQTLS